LNIRVEAGGRKRHELITDYKIIYAISSDQLEELVNQAIKDGWQPLGPLVLGSVAFLQTMVKEESYDASPFLKSGNSVAE
jgi:hypothetical protein